MAFERDTKRSSDSGSRPITSNNIVRRKELLTLWHNSTHRHALLILFQPPKSMAPFNLEGVQFLGMFKDDCSEIILSHVGGYEIVLEIALGEFSDFHCREDFVVFVVRGAKTDPFFVGERVVDHVVEDAYFVHLVENNGEVTERCKLCPVQSWEERFQGGVRNCSGRLDDICFAVNDSSLDPLLRNLKRKE